MIPSLLLYLPLAVTAADQDEVLLLRVDPDQQKAAMLLFLHRLGSPADDCLQPPLASDLKFEKLGKKKPVRFAFGLDVDGDGSDEIAVVREKNKGKHLMQLRVFRAPPTLTSNTGAPIASTKKGALGNGAGPDRVVAMTGWDADGDGRDEVAMVRERVDGSLFLEIRRPPGGKNKALGAAVASDPVFELPAGQELAALCSADVDQDFQDELVCLLQGGGLPDRLVGCDAPAGPFADTGPPVFDVPDASAPEGFENVAVAPIRASSASALELLFTRRETASGRTRLDVHAVPNGGPLAPPILSDEALDLNGFEYPVMFTAVRRHSGQPPWVDLSGTWEVRYLVGYTNLAGDIVFEWVGPFPGFTFQANAAQQVFVEFPGDASDSGSVNSWASGAKCWFSSINQFPGPSFTTTQASGIVQAGDKIVVSYPQGTLEAAGGGWTISGFNPWGFSIGEVQTPSGQLRAAVMQYEYKKP